MKKYEEPWRKKEPDGRLNKKAIVHKQKGLQEREGMEQLSTAKFQLNFNYLLKEPKQWRAVTVTFLKRPLSEQEIIERMQKAFGDI